VDEFGLLGMNGPHGGGRRPLACVARLVTTSNVQGLLTTDFATRGELH